MPLSQIRLGLRGLGLSRCIWSPTGYPPEWTEPSWGSSLSPYYREELEKPGWVMVYWID